MRYSSAVVLSTLAIGQAAASNMHNRHASFHARRQAEAKRSGDSAVNWDAVAYDLKDVDWSAVNWSSVFSSTPAAEATPTPTPEQYDVTTPTPTPEQKKATPTPSPSPVVVVSSAQPVQSSKAVEVKAAAASPSASASATAQSTSTKSSNLVTDLLQGVSDIATSLKAKVGKNDKASNGGIWIGSDGKYGMDVTNAGSNDAVFFCWVSSGYSGMSISTNVPAISVGLKAGEKVSLSFAAAVPAACSPATSSTTLALFGGIANTWAEVTFGGQWGTFDVSRNVNMKGSTISMQGSLCKSDMDTCVFKCKDSSATSCKEGTDYDLYNCNASGGGGGGYDTIAQGTGGGCSASESGERLIVSFAG